MTHQEPNTPDPTQPEIDPATTPGPEIQPAETPDEMPPMQQPNDVEPNQM